MWLGSMWLAMWDSSSELVDRRIWEEGGGANTLRTGSHTGMVSPRAVQSHTLQKPWYN